MKKYFRFAMVAAAIAVAMPSWGKGLGELNIFNHLGVGLSASTNGIGVEVATPITDFVTLRGGVSIMPGISFNTELDGTYSLNNKEEYFNMDVEGALKRTQGSVIFNVYPFASHSSFYVAAGAYFGGKDIVKISGHSDELAAVGADNPTIDLGDYKIPVDRNGNVDGSLRVKNFRPYLGLGFGRPVPHRRLNFGVELGVQFMGKMKVYSAGDELQQVLTDNDDDWQKWIDKLTVYPVLKFTLSGRIF